jgi:hypothetical protein
MPFARFIEIAKFAHALVRNRTIIRHDARHHAQSWLGERY